MSNQNANENASENAYNFTKDFDDITRPGLDRFLATLTAVHGDAVDGDWRAEFAKTYRSNLWRTLSDEQIDAEIREEGDWSADRAAEIAAQFEANAIHAEMGGDEAESPPCDPVHPDDPVMAAAAEMTRAEVDADAWTSHSESALQAAGQQLQDMRNRGLEDNAELVSKWILKQLREDRRRAENEARQQERAKRAKQERADRAGWPNPEPLPNPLLPVAEFDVEFLPECLQPWVTDTSYRMQCPADFVGASLINLLGAVIGRKMGIRPKQFDDWTEFANLWGIIVARPGEKKSPAMDAVLSFQARLIAQAAEKHAEALKAYQKEFKKYELIKGAKEAKAKALAKKAVESGDDDFDLDDSLLDDSEPPVRPSIRRYATNDATYEKLADLHVANPNGLMVHQDEMIALMRKLDNPDNADWRAFALTGWGGKSSHTVDRIGRGTQTIPHVCLSLFGATQPERIATYVRPAITGSEDDDGLCQRFQMMVWPDTDKPWVYVDQWPDNEAKNEVLGGCRMARRTRSGERRRRHHAPVWIDAVQAIRRRRASLVDRVEYQAP